MAIWVGTSGYNYPEWRGSFYPQKLATTKMLAYYAERLATVEINYTFYRAPTPAILGGWSGQTPAAFKFTLKAPKRITHDARLRDCAGPLHRFIATAATLGPKLGMLLFQLPPFFRKDLAVLDALNCRLPSRSPRIAPISGCETRATRRTTSSAGRGRSRRGPPAAGRSSSTSSTKRLARGRSSLGC